jgi:hypothetical protein
MYFWCNMSTGNVGRSWYPPESSAIIDATLFTDASSMAWGSHLHLDISSLPSTTYKDHDQVLLGHGAFTSS